MSSPGVVLDLQNHLDAELQRDSTAALLWVGAQVGFTGEPEVCRGKQKHKLKSGAT